MGPTFKINIYCKERLVYEGEVGGCVEMGRQQRAEEPLFVEQLTSGGRRIAIAPIEESTISRSHLRIEPISEQHFEAANLSTHNVVSLGVGPPLPPAKSGQFTLPALFKIGDAAIWLEQANDAEQHLETLSRPTLPPKAGGPLGVTESVSFRTDRAAAQALPSLLAGPAAERGLPDIRKEGQDSIVAWLQAVIEVLQSAASSTDFFERAAAAIVKLVGLDSGCVLSLDGEKWLTRAQSFSSPQLEASGAARPSARILARMQHEKRTYWQTPAAGGAITNSQSLANVQAVVVSPILDPQGRAIGALYGDRRTGPGKSASISRLEAMLVETLACGVAAGLARLDQEQKAIAARVQFEQFFSPELAHQLTIEPDLLRGRDAEVTVIFSDIRGFSRIADRLGPASTLEWVSAVLGALSDCVIRHGGVLVDYIGDELMAMWGAPLAHADHAERACRAALEMIESLPALNKTWASKVGEEFGLAIGVNTGIARVGNTGTHRKFKYGPLGSTVNLASRVQGATKYLKAPAIVTAATRSRLGSEFVVRRLCKVRVVNIQEPIELYELRGPVDSNWPTIREKYERAVSQFEQRDFPAAADTLRQLLTANPADRPAQVLLSRITAFLANPDVEFQEAWELPGK